MTTQKFTTKQRVEMAICRALADKNVFMPVSTAQDCITVEPWMGGWRIVRDGEGLYWQWDKDTADLMADGLRYRIQPRPERVT